MTKKPKQALEQIRAAEIAARNNRALQARMRGLIRAACERFDEMELFKIFLEECGALDETILETFLKQQRMDESDALEVLWNSVRDHDDLEEKMHELTRGKSGGIVLEINRLDHQEKLRSFLETEIWTSVSEQTANINF